MFPLISTVSFTGDILALVAGPPSPLYPAVPLPPIVVIMPDVLIFLIL
jgi:hypothetical protein